MIGRSISHYRILEKLGEGGMGAVYKARDLHLDRFVAIKVIPPEKVGDEDRRRRFVFEAKAASALSHPNIVTIYDIDSEAGVHFIAMEYIPGKTLADSIGPTGLPIREALDRTIEISGALAAAHSEGIIHRDLKPANVMISEQGVAKILDFGLAKLAEKPESPDETTLTAALTAPGTVLGTVAYMSPEQASGQYVDVRTDIYSFGSLLYEMLTGNRAFAGNSAAAVQAAILRDSAPPVETLRRDIPRELARILQRCLEKDPANRYPSAMELHNDLIACRRRAISRSTGFSALISRPRFAVPSLILLLVLLACGTWFVVQASRIRWAHGTAIPTTARLIEQEKPDEAFRLLRQAARYIPHDSELNKLMNQCAVAADIRTTPPGAEVSWKSYREVDSPWESLGKSPLKGPLVPRAYLRWKIVKEGYEPQELAFDSGPITAALYRKPMAPGMAHIPTGAFAFQPTQPMELDEFWLDRHEVTNRQFKKFVDRDGYQEVNYWKHAFVDNGKRISWEEAMARLVDATGRPGPATWELGTYPEGQEDYPVSGVSWYEAAAYAEFAGKSLPTIYHWRRAAPSGDFSLVSLSNFGGKGPARVGSHQGLSPFGNFDMAGNVKEWCWNEVGGFRYLLGGAWNEQTYQFIEMDGQPPFTRLATYGFRCAKYVAPVPTSLMAEYRYLQRDYAREKPAKDEIYRAYKNLFAYDPVELAPSKEAVDESQRDWRREKVTFNAAYGNERITAVMFLPRNSKPPYQTVVYFPGASAFMLNKTSDSIKGSDPNLDYIIRSGRAVMYPIYWQSYERKHLKEKPSPTSIIGRDLIVACGKDLGRSIDYLKTRLDIDGAKLAYCSYSAGAAWGPVFMAVDGRFRTAVFMLAGLMNEAYRPEVDPLHFASHVRMPVLMLNGRFDFTYPLQTCQLPLFRLLGVREPDKRHVLFDTAHFLPRNPMIKEVLDWLDRYLGPVRTTG